MDFATIYPLIVLSIGVVVVIGMIVAMKANAFVALISAAIIVSLMSPGMLSERVSRVAFAFGGTVGKIGIVIAMAALIGKCMMDSGAADRVVRWFLKLLGEKRAATALMGSGFVLAVPVFFDTVFYLLVPLARSLWTRTRKNYLLYILAIATGGAITHTLVPPTPGPLFMASELNIELGVMILMGAAIALPTAIVGLLVCGIMNRMMDVPMRPYAGEPEPEVLEDDQLPSLWLSLLPVILPVVLISANTITKTMADSQHAAHFQAGDVTDWPAFVAEVEQLPARGEMVTEETAELLTRATATAGQSAETQQQALGNLNDLLKNKGLFPADRFAPVTLPKAARQLADRSLNKVSQAELERYNRLVLETLFPTQIKPHVWDTPRRKVANVLALLGDPNLALILSAAVAMFVLVWNRKLSFGSLAESTEAALMSGGLIILITAGGGAFGAMLKEAGVKDSIESLIGDVGGDLGLMFLLTGFGVAAVFKVAVGSSTVAMMTTASMFAAMAVSSQTLGFNCVYLATAIGCGSLFGSWMNDSGFWIFARMGNVTELEALKSWTILLAIIGATGLCVTLLFAWLLPLV